MELILFTGLPGTGKSTLAKAVSQQLQIPVFAKDIVEAALLRCNVSTVLEDTKPVNYAAYEVLIALAAHQLDLNQSCIVDCVAGHPAVRNHFRTLANKHSARWIVIECICSNEEIHRTRLTTRQRNIPGYRELTWPELLATKERFTLWTEERLIIDSVTQLDENVNKVSSYITGVTQLTSTSPAP